MEREEHNIGSQDKTKLERESNMYCRAIVSGFGALRNNMFG